MHLRLKLGAASALDSLGALTWLRRSRKAGGLVLTFHRVLEERDLHTCYEPHIAMRAASFATLLDLLREEYRVVPLEELLADPTPVRHDRPRVAITFDDGWEDTCSVAAPLLAARGMPATVFLCSALVEDAGRHTLRTTLPEERFARIWRAASDQQRLANLLRDLETWRVGDGASPHVHAWGRRLKRLPLSVKLMMLSHLEEVYRVPAPEPGRFLNWDQARSLQKQGIGFGSHTARHASLDAEEPATVLDELTRSREAIEREIGTTCRTLAYPNGAFSSRVLEAAAASGYRYAFTTEPGFVTDRTESLAIPRLCLSDPVVEAEDGALHLSRTRLYLQQLRTPGSRASVRRPLGSLSSEPAAPPACSACQERRARRAGPELPAAVLPPGRHK